MSKKQKCENCEQSYSHRRLLDHNCKPYMRFFDYRAPQGQKSKQYICKECPFRTYDPKVLQYHPSVCPKADNLNKSSKFRQTNLSEQDVQEEYSIEVLPQESEDEEYRKKIMIRAQIALLIFIIRKISVFIDGKWQSKPRSVIRAEFLYQFYYWNQWTWQFRKQMDKCFDTHSFKSSEDYSTIHPHNILPRLSDLSELCGESSEYFIKNYKGPGKKRQWFLDFKCQVDKYVRANPGKQYRRKMIRKRKNPQFAKDRLKLAQRKYRLRMIIENSAQIRKSRFMAQGNNHNLSKIPRFRRRQRNQLTQKKYQHLQMITRRRDQYFRIQQVICSKNSSPRQVRQARKILFFFQVADASTFNQWYHSYRHGVPVTDDYAAIDSKKQHLPSMINSFTQFIATTIQQLHDKRGKWLKMADDLFDNIDQNERQQKMMIQIEHFFASYGLLKKKVHSVYYFEMVKRPVYTIWGRLIQQEISFEMKQYKLGSNRTTINSETSFQQLMKDIPSYNAVPFEQRRAEQREFQQDQKAQQLQRRISFLSGDWKLTDLQAIQQTQNAPDFIYQGKFWARDKNFAEFKRLLKKEATGKLEQQLKKVRLNEQNALRKAMYRRFGQNGGKAFIVPFKLKDK